MNTLRCVMKEDSQKFLQGNIEVEKIVTYKKIGLHFLDAVIIILIARNTEPQLVWEVKRINND